MESSKRLFNWKFIFQVINFIFIGLFALGMIICAIMVLATEMVGIGLLFLLITLVYAGAYVVLTMFLYTQANDVEEIRRSLAHQVPSAVSAADSEIHWNKTARVCFYIILLITALSTLIGTIYWASKFETWGRAFVTILVTGIVMFVASTGAMMTLQQADSIKFIKKVILVSNGMDYMHDVPITPITPIPPIESAPGMEIPVVSTPAADGSTMKLVGANTNTAALCGIGGSYQGQTIDLIAGQPIRIGRDPKSSNLIIKEEGISRLHCSITFDWGLNVYILIDESTNGVFDRTGNRYPAKTPIQLKHGSTIKIGNSSNVFELK